MKHSNIIASEQFKISIGQTARERRRANLLAAARQPAGARAESQVTIAACGSCGTPATTDQRGIAVAQCGCSTNTLFNAVGPSSVPLNPSGAGSLVANPMPTYPDPMPGAYPAALCDRRTGVLRSDSWSSMLRNSRMARLPYQDPYYDSVWMDEILSDRTTVAAGVSVDIELTPTAGTFALFYLEIVAVDPTTQVEQVDWTAARARVEGCPVPCSSGDTEALAQFVMKVPESCCGIPIVAWLDEESRNTPLIVPFTNRQAAGDLLVQLRGRGYCCNERIC